MSFRDLPKIRDSLSYAYVEHARLEQADGAIAVIDASGETQLPVAALATIMLGPGTTITQAAVKTAAAAGCSLLWVGEDGDRVYAHGLGETRSSRRLLVQAECHSDITKRAAVVLRMYEARFKEHLPVGMTIQQVRGFEGVRVRTAYQQLSQEFHVPWRGRRYDRGDWGAADTINRALSTAASCLYGVCQAAIISAGYSTALGFVHTGKLLSFVYDIADLYRMDVVAPVAFKITAEHGGWSDKSKLGRDIRAACRDAIREHDVMGRVVRDIDRLLEIDQAAVAAAASLVDGMVDAPGGLWNPAGDEDAAGGVNYGGDDPGEGADGDQR
jgi:CRISPR-associated protein Cas1